MNTMILGLLVSLMVLRAFTHLSISKFGYLVYKQGLIKKLGKREYSKTYKQYNEFINILVVIAVSSYLSAIVSWYTWDENYRLFNLSYEISWFIRFLFTYLCVVSGFILTFAINQLKDDLENCYDPYTATEHR